MPLLDVSDVLDDPDFCETISVSRTVKSPPVGGVTPPSTPTVFTLVVVVQPATSNDLLRMLDADRVRGAIAIWAKGDDALMPKDIVTWRGSTYTINTMDDWSQFGGGYVRALAGQTSFR